MRKDAFTDAFWDTFLKKEEESNRRKKKAMFVEKRGKEEKSDVGRSAQLCLLVRGAGCSSKPGSARLSKSQKSPALFFSKERGEALKSCGSFFFSFSFMKFSFERSGARPPDCKSFQMFRKEVAQIPLPGPNAIA